MHNRVTHLDEMADVDVDTAAPTDQQALLFDAGSSLWVPGDVAAGGASELPRWSQDNVAASQTDVALTLLDGTRETVRVLAGGDLTAVLVESTEARTAGTLTVTVQVNGVDTALTATIDGTNTEWHKGTVTVAVSEGDEVGVVVTTDGTWAPTTAEILVGVQVGTSGGGGGWSADVAAATYSLADSTQTPVPWDTLHLDQLGGFDIAGASPHIWTCPSDGLYEILTSWEPQSTGTGRRLTRLRLAAAPFLDNEASPTAVNSSGITASTHVSLAANDEIDIVHFHGIGATVDIKTTVRIARLA